MEGRIAEVEGAEGAEGAIGSRDSRCLKKLFRLHMMELQRKGVRLSAESHSLLFIHTD